MKSNFLPADILLPKENFEKWSVIACDQYTSQINYWKETEKIASNSPSALNIIFPEAYLGGDDEKYIAKINENMQNYVNSNVFNEFANTLVYVERTLKDGKIRRGLVGLIDLEDYSYLKGATTGIRATEATVLERIPPRVNIRKDAVIEMPHVMLLFDDPLDSVIKPINDNKNNYDVLYDFTLMQNAGSIKGYSVDSDGVLHINESLAKIKEKSADGLLFAVGDGNHSLASAKECYQKGFGPRYALVEIVNIHDFSLEFEPIYRVVFGADGEKLIDDFVASLGGIYKGSDAQKFICVLGDKSKEISVKGTGKLCVATLQSFLDEYIKENSDIKIDYIHGTDAVYELAKEENTVGFIFDGMEKSELFIAVSADGSLPRKTFSMGCADDKRFYLECRKIK